MPGDTQQRIQKKFLRNKHNGRQEIDLYMKKKKISLRKIILLLMILGCLTSAVAIILTSYSSLQLMNQNNIEDNMKMNLYQFTKESDEACYKLLRVLNQMSADGMVGSAVDKYLTQEEHYDQYVNKKNLRAQLVSLNSSSPSLLIAFYYGIYPVEGIGVFRVPKNGDARNKKPPALRVETKRCTKKSPFRYNRVVQALL